MARLAHVRHHPTGRLDRAPGSGWRGGGWRGGGGAPRGRAVGQRVGEARARVDEAVVGEIGPGLCVLVGVTHDDTVATAHALARKLWHLRVFADDEGVMNRTVADTTG